MNRRNGGTHGAIALAVLLLATLPLPAASAQAPGTVPLDLRIHAGPVDLRPGPLAVPDPFIPNVSYDVLRALDPVQPVLPVSAEDAPDGFYIASPLGSQRLVAWQTGVEQHHIAPVEVVGRALEDGVVPVVEVQGCACPVPGPGVSGSFRDPLPPSASGNLAATSVPGQRVPPDDERPPQVATVRPDLARPMDYQAPLPQQRDGVATERAQQLAPTAAPDAAPFIAIVAAAAGLVLLKLLLPLYHRFKKKTALDNATRKRVYELLRGAPGASAAELGEASQLHVTTVKYHLDVLRKVGMVGEQVVDGCRRFYSYENGDRVEFLTRALLDEPAARAIFHQIASHPGLPFIEVAKALGMRKEHVHYHVKKLTRHGLVADRWEGGRRLLFPAVPGGHRPLEPSLPAHPAPAPPAPSLPAAILSAPPEVRS
jgi:DNA-binding transcriptional ArsR family regulator